MKLQVLKRCTVFQTILWLRFFLSVKVTSLTSANFRSVDHGHCTYTVILHYPCSTVTQLAVEYDLCKSFIVLSILNLDKERKKLSLEMETGF